MFSTQPARSARRGTPITHCAAAALVWYLVFMGVSSATGRGADAGLALVMAVVLWAPTTVVMWLVLLRVRLRPWASVLVALPVSVVVWALVAGLLDTMSDGLKHMAA